MSKSERLFMLIQAMNPSEKMNFKRICGTDKDKKYIRLFDYINSMNDYDEKVILKKFKDDPLAKNFSLTKRYLYDSIMKSLRIYEPKNNRYVLMDRHLKDARIFYTKYMVDECERNLKEAKEIAYELESFSTVLEIMEFEKNIWIRYRLNKFNEFVQQLLEEERRILEKIDILNQIRQLYYKMFEIVLRNNTMRTKDDAVKAKELISHPIFSNIENALSFWSKILFYQSHCFYHDMNKEPEEAYNMSKKMVALWETHPALKKEELEKYITVYSSHGNRSYTLGHYDELLPIVQTFKDVDANELRISVLLFEQIKYFECLFYGKKRDYKTLDLLMKEVDKGMKKYGELMRPTMILWFYRCFSDHLFAQERFDEALDWINRFLDFFKLDIQQDTFRVTRFMDIIIHYELGNIEILEGKIRAYQRFVNQQKRQYLTERIVLKLINHAKYEYNKEGKKKLFGEALHELTKINNNPEEKLFLEHTNIIDWIQSRSKGITILEAIEEEQTVKN